MNALGFAAVGAGAALGAWLRWFLGVTLNATMPNLPLGTLSANLLGGYLIGVAVQVFMTHASLPPELRLLIITGFLGGLTTFSTFSAESVELLQSESYGAAAVLVVAHLAGSLIMTWLGIWTVRSMSAS